MAWLDPPECVAARDSLKQGNPAQAARLLLAGRYPGHRAVRNLLVETGQRLVELAEEQLQSGQLEPAQASIELATRCVALEGRALVMQNQVTEALQRQRQREAWLGEQLDEARRQADAGRLYSSLDVLASLEEYGPAFQLRDTVEKRLAHFQRHAEACEQAIQAGRPQVAHRYWQQAKQIMPDDPRLAELAAAIARAMPSAAPTEAVVTNQHP